MSREIDHVDDFVDQLIAMNPGLGLDDLSFTSGDLMNYLLVYSGFIYSAQEGSQLLQDHKKAQETGRPPRHSVYCRKRGSDAVWGIGTPEAVDFINSTAISWAAQSAINRIVQCASPAAASDPSKQRSIAFAQKGIENRLTELAEMLEIMK